MPHSPHMLSPTDQALLGWFFGPGIAAIERSNMGGMLTNAELRSAAGAVEWFRYQVNVGRALLWEYGLRVSFDVLARESSAWPYCEDGAIIYPEDEITAWPTGEMPSVNLSSPAEWVMERYDRASSGIRDMLERAEAVELGYDEPEPHTLRAVDAYAVLLNYCGDLGSIWASHSAVKIAKVGRIGALYHLTPAGRRLLAFAAEQRKRAGQPPSSASETDQMQNEVAVAGGNAKEKNEVRDRRRIGLIKTDRHARELLRGACVLWNGASSRRPRRTG